MYTKPLFVINPALKGFKKKYIYGIDSKAFWLFKQLCSLRIAVEGFIGTGQEIPAEFFHKPVYELDEISHKEDVEVLLTQYVEHPVENSVYCDWAVRMETDIHKKIAIYGAGYVGKIVKAFLEDRGFEVSFFIETDMQRKGKMVEDIPVYSQEILQNFPKETTLIEAGKYWQDMEQLVQDKAKNIERYYVEELTFLYICKNPEKILVENIHGRTLEPYTIIQLEEHFKDKELILYGGEFCLLKKYAELLHLFGYVKVTIALDFKLTGIIEDSAYQTEDISEVMYKNNYIVLVVDWSKRMHLEQLGLLEIEDYVFIQFPSVVYQRMATLDINLGNMILPDSNIKNKVIYPGIYVHGSEKEDTYKIIILGGSTTEGGRNRFPSWPELLYDKLTDLGKKVTVYNCGMSGYTSTQELIRLLRDALKLKPNLVLDYSGYNDISQAAFGLRRNYSFPRSKDVFEYVIEQNKMKQFVEGTENKCEADVIWMENMLYMDAVSKVNNALFVAFMQPCFVNKKVMVTDHEKQLDKMLKAYYGPEFLETAREFYKNVREKMKHTGKVYDLSHIFDEEDVYMDICHVYERGNEIIADKIVEKIKEYIN